MFRNVYDANRPNTASGFNFFSGMDLKMQAVSFWNRIRSIIVVHISENLFKMAKTFSRHDEFLHLNFVF